MTALLVVLLLAPQETPSLHDLRTITDGYVRSGCWVPLRVKVSGPPGFQGRLTGSADAGFRVTRPVRIPPGGTADVLLPVVVLGRDARIEVTLSGPSGDLQRRSLEGLKMLDRERLVLVDPRHPEADEWMRQPVMLPNGTPVRFAVSDPADWNEAAEVGAMEAVDAVVVSEGRAGELTMTTWRALGGGLITMPRQDLVKRLEEPAARFPAIDPIVGRFSVSDSWIPQQRNTTLLFIVVYGFAFFVIVFATWSRKGGGWMLLASAVAASALFVGAYSAFFPKGSLAVRTWQGIVDTPEAPIAISVSSLWGSGRAGDLAFGRIVKPVHATHRETIRRDLELALGDEGTWTARGAMPGDATRFVTVERLQALAPFRPHLDGTGKAVLYRAEESEYYLRVPRKNWIRLQDPETAPPPQVRGTGILETRAARVFRIEARR